MTSATEPHGWRRHWPLALAMACGVALRFWALGRSALYQDEAYYWLWSQRLAPAYYDHPAGVALLIRVSTALAGDSEAGIRWLNAALGAAAVGAVYLLTLRLGSVQAATLASAWIASAPPFLLTSRFVYPDVLQHVLLPLALLPIIGLITQPERELTWKQAALTGLLWALFLNTKYSAYLAAALAVGAALWLRPELLRNARFWGAVGLACLGLLPALAWNATHEWASFRWQSRHLLQGGLLSGSLASGLSNLADYIGVPLLVFVARDLVPPRGRHDRLIWVLALGLSAPAALSPANSPRNLTMGLLLLVALAASGWLRWAQDRGSRGRWIALGAWGLLALNALWGLGGVVASTRPTWLPHSRAATLMRQDAAGWREARGLGFQPHATLYSIDYSIAGQLSYYTGRPAHSSWGQFVIWGAPALDEVDVVALRYADADRVTARLAQDFGVVSGPEEWQLGAGDAAKLLRVWRAREPRVGAGQIVADLDLAGLLPGR